MRGSFIPRIQFLCGVGLGAFLLGCPLMPDPGTGDGDNGGDMESKLAVFSDPDSEFTTSDVYDVEDQIVRFNTENDSIVWAEDGAEYDVGEWSVDGNFPESTMFFQIRFGIKDGARRAYFTEAGRATICDIRVADGALNIFATNETVPTE